MCDVVTVSAEQCGRRPGSLVCAMKSEACRTRNTSVIARVFESFLYGSADISSYFSVLW